jgi:hypothetical protein
MATEATKFDRPFQAITGEHGEWEVHVARHSEAPTFTFDVIAPAEDVGVTEGRRAISCHNMTRADLEEHIARCQAALDA